MLIFKRKLVMDVRACGLAVLAVMFSPVAVADVYLCENEAGAVSLSNVDAKSSCKKMKLQPKPKYPPSYEGGKKNNDNNQINSQQNSNQNKGQIASFEEALAERKRIVLEELGLEKRRLEMVLSMMAGLADNENRGMDGQKSLAEAKNKASLHRSNIQLLEKEYSRLN